jgi:hypothetical protein
MGLLLGSKVVIPGGTRWLGKCVRAWRASLAKGLLCTVLSPTAGCRWPQQRLCPSGHVMTEGQRCCHGCDGPRCLTCLSGRDGSDPRLAHTSPPCTHPSGADHLTSPHITTQVHMSSRKFRGRGPRPGHPRLAALRTPAQSSRSQPAKGAANQAPPIMATGKEVPSRRRGRTAACGPMVRSQRRSKAAGVEVR